MKKYCYSVTNNRVWFDAAKSLYDDNIARPVLWLGDDVHFENARHCFGEDVVLRMLDIVHYQHEIADFEYNSESFGFFSSINYLRTKDRCLKMMDRLDLYGLYSRIDREAVFNKLAIFFLHRIKKADPDALIVAEAPHSHAQYLMYEICLYLGIKVAKFNTWTAAPLLFLQDMSSGRRQMRRITISPVVSKALDQEIESYLENFANNNWKNEHYEVNYMRKHRLANRWHVKLRNLILVEIKNLIREFLGQLKRYYDGNYYPVNPYRLGFKTRQKIKSMRKKNLRKHFLKNVEKIDFSKRFVYFALHFEPERTTNPDGNEYHDQFFALLELRKFLPDEIDIVVKEHPSQFLVAPKGSRGRSPLIYKLLKNVKGVKLAGLDQDSLKLVNCSEFVATISGTVALEAALMKKKSIIFGDSWYANCPNVIKWSSNIDYSVFSSVPIKEKSEIFDYFFDSHRLHAIPGFQNGSCAQHWSKFDTKEFREEELKGICQLMQDYLLQK